MLVGQKKVLKLKETIVEQDLAIIKLLNTKSISGAIYGYAGFSYNTYIEDGGSETNTANNYYLYALIESYKKWRMNQFIYTGLEKLEGVSKGDLEGALFNHGLIALIKIGGEYAVLPFITKRKSWKNVIEVITPIAPNSKIQLRDYTVGIDCVIIADSIDGFLTITGSFSTLWKAWFMLSDISNEYDTILTGSAISLPKIAVGDDTDSVEADNINNAIKSKKIAITFDIKSLEQRVLTGAGSTGSVFGFDDRRKQNWENYENMFSNFKELKGIQHDPNKDKAERKNVEETTSNNVYTDAIINADAETRFGDDHNVGFGIVAIEKVFGIKISGRLNKEEKDTSKGETENVEEE